MINRFRFRARDEALGRGDIDAARFAASAAFIQQGLGVSQVVGTHILGPAGGFHPGQPMMAARVPMHPRPPSQPLHPLSRAGAGVRPSPPGSPAGVRPVDPVSPALRLTPSPRLRPVKSPELRSSRAAIDLDDDLDDDGMAFPSSDFDSKYDSLDDNEDVYADFGAIFGGAPEGESSDEEEDHFEDLMDELDGIPWSVR